jgi:hypothetical protein
MSEVKVNKISPRSGTDVTLGDSSDTFTVPSGATLDIASGATIANSGTATGFGDYPTFTSVSPDVATNDLTSLVITGTNFGSSGIPSVEFQSSTGAITAATSVVRDSTTQLTVGCTVAVDGTYFIRIELNTGLAVRSSTAVLNISDAPVWSTGAGSIGTPLGNFSGTVTTVAASGDTVTYSETTDVLTNASLANCSLNSSTGAITTTDFGGSSTSATLYTFTLRATDAQGQTSDREFTLTSVFATGGTIVDSGGYRYHTFLADGTFGNDQSRTVEYLVVGGGGGGGYYAGGGGGAGGLLSSSFSATASDYTIVVGDGGLSSPSAGSGSNTGSSGVASTVTGTNASVSATGGGGGGGGSGGNNGGSGGSGGGGERYGSGTGTGGSGTVGQGNDGATISSGNQGGGGGGAGAAGSGQNGGAGLNTYSTWATATSTGDSGYYAGGGGGYTGGTGGDGGGGAYSAEGTANTGGGAGGDTATKYGGSGIVILRYSI